MTQRGTQERCAFVSAAQVRCYLDVGHAGGHRPYPREWDDALPQRPEAIADPLPEDLERLLRDPSIAIPQDAKVHAVIAGDLEKHPETASVPRGAYLNLWALFQKVARDV